MRGDKLVIQKGHRKAARQITAVLLSQIMQAEGKFIITIAGESGSGKSEIATALSQLLTEKGIESLIFQQDDYFVYPPKTNAGMRRQNINHVGLSEVRLTLLDQHLHDILMGKTEIDKPLVIFDDDLITEETAKLEGIKVVIIDGTYTSLLENVHRKIFLERTYIDTREARKSRAREEQDDFLERVLEIEHKIISSHRDTADIIVTSTYDVRAKR